MESNKILFETKYSPGDDVVFTAAVRDLANAYPEIQIGIKSPSQSIWENNPYLTKFDSDLGDVVKISVDCPAIEKIRSLSCHYINAYRMFLEDSLDRNIPGGVCKGDIYLKEEEKEWMSQVQEKGIDSPFWLIFAGGKTDVTCKWYPHYQKIVDALADRVLFVQVGASSDHHPRLNNALNLVGKTSLRQLIRLVYHSSGVISPVSLGMHLAAAVPTNKSLLGDYERPCVVIAGGREPVSWEKYQSHCYFGNDRPLKCSLMGGCWRNRCQKMNDGDSRDTERLCESPVQVGDLMYPKCMAQIDPLRIIDAVEGYVEATEQETVNSYKLFMNGNFEKSKGFR